MPKRVLPIRRAGTSVRLRRRKRTASAGLSALIGAAALVAVPSLTPVAHEARSHQTSPDLAKTGAQSHAGAPGSAATGTATLQAVVRPASGPFVAAAAASATSGWKVSASGGVVTYGGAPSYGSIHHHLNRPIVGIAATPDHHGYWLVAADGGVFTFGDAHFFGSLASVPLGLDHAVALAPTPSGGGYWIATAGGRIAHYGNAQWYGSPKSAHVGSAVVGMASSADGRGYVALTVAGGVTAFGDAPWRGSLFSAHVRAIGVGIVAGPGGGYWVATGTGKVYGFGDSRFVGGPEATAAPSAIFAEARAYALLLHGGQIVNAPTGSSALKAPPATPSGVPTSPAPPVTSPPTTVPVASPPTTVPVAPPPTPAPATSGSGLSFGIFVHPLGSAPISASSSQYVAAFVNDYKTNYGAVGVNQMPVRTVAGNQPLVHVSVAPGCNNFTSSTGSMIPIPAGTQTLGYGDSPLVIDQPSTSTEWELWQAMPSPSGGWQACWGGRLDTATSNGVFPVPFGLSGSGISYLATTITEADVASGSINHAIAVDLPACSSPPAAPANRTDCSLDPGQPPEGTWFRFPADLAMPSGLTPFGQMVFRAVQTYGMVVTDQAGAVMIQAENTSDWAAQGHSGVDPITASWQGLAEYQVVANLPWSQLQVIQP